MKKVIVTIVIALLVGVSLFPIINKAKAGDPSSTEKKTTTTEANLTEENQSRLLKATPAPQLDDSQERKNFIERLKRLNDSSKVGYVYLVGNQGQIIGYYTIKGKVSSLNSLLTTPEQIVDDPNGSYDSGSVVVPSPDLDGSYGANPEGVFFFTTAGAMIEWTGDYMYSDQPMSFTSKPILVENVN